MPEVSNDPIAEALLNDTPIRTEPQEPQTPVETPVVQEPITPAPEPEIPQIPENQPAAIQTNWLQEVSKSTGLELNNEDELKSLLSKAKSYDDLEGRYKTINQEYEQSKASAFTPADDYIRKLNDLKLGGASAETISAFNTLNQVGEIKDLQPLDTAKLALQLRDGLTPEEATIYLNSKYKLDADVYDADAIRQSEIALKLDAKRDAEFLEGYKAKVSENPAKAQEQEIQQQVAEYYEKIKPVAKSIQDSLTSISINLNGKQGADAITVDLPVSEEARAKIASVVTDYATSTQMPLNQEGIKELSDFSLRVAKLETYDAMAKHIASTTEARIRAEFHNPASINRGTDNPVETSAAIRAKQIEDQILNS